MALDSELLTRAEGGEIGWRVYEWDGPWVSLGRFQRPGDALVPGWERWVPRPTGGRAVLHGHDLTVAIAVPHDRRSRAVREVYRALVAPILCALRACGLEADLGGERAAPKTASEDCFAVAAANDLVATATEQKVCGCALRVTARAALLQASIPYKQPLVDPAEAIIDGVPTSVLPWRWEAFECAFDQEMAALHGDTPRSSLSSGKGGLESGLTA